MNSAELEKKANKEREKIKQTTLEIDRELSPGQLLDEYYFKGSGKGFKGYITRLSDDPVPGALVGAAIALSANREHSYGSGIKDKAIQAKNKISHKTKAGIDSTKQSYAKAKSGVSETSDKMKSSLSSAKDSAKIKSQKVGGQIKGYSTKTVDTVKSNPSLNIAAGFSIGTALGSLLPLTDIERKKLDTMADKTLDLKDSAIDKAHHKLNRTPQGQEPTYH